MASIVSTRKVKLQDAQLVELTLDYWDDGTTTLRTSVDVGTVALDAASLAALENVTATLDAPSLAALESIGVHGEAGGTPVPAVLNADARTGALASVELTMSATPGTVKVVTVPDTARGFNLYPRSNPCRFAVGEDPTTVAVVAAGTNAVSAATLAASVGGIAKADLWMTRLLDTGATRTVRLTSLVASAIVDFEAF